MNVNGIDYPIETPTYVLNENFRNFAPEGLTTVAVSGDEYTSAIILKTPRYYKNLDLSEYTTRAYYYTHWLDDEQKSSEGSVILLNFEVQENEIVYVWQLDINQTYKKGRVDFGLSWSNGDWKLNTKGCYFTVQRFVSRDRGYVAPDIAEILQNEIDELSKIKQDKQDNNLKTEDKTVVGAINGLNDFENRPEGFATEEQGGKADSAIQSVNGINPISATTLQNQVELVLKKDTSVSENGSVKFGVNGSGELTGQVDVSMFITNTVNDLVNYYTKSETYTQQQVNDLISQIQSMHFEVVNVLPDPSLADSNIIYLVPRTISEDNNIYDEYIRIVVPNTDPVQYTFEKIGSTDIDLTGYATEDWVITQISGFLTQQEIQNLIDTSISGKADITYVDNADNNLQEQIDAIASSSDVVDVVGTYAELQAYDTQHLKNNDIVKVLQDETKDDAITYYRWVINQQTHTGSWEYIGQSGPYYTKSETQEYVSEATANFITNTVNNLTNYYLKSETYDRTEVNNLIGAIQTARFEIVNVLPPIGESNVIYLILRSDPETSNIYDEYIYINNTYEKIGSTDVDLTGYATENWVTQQISVFLTQTQIETLINTALTNYYTQTQTDTLLDGKENVNNILDYVDYVSINNNTEIQITALKSAYYNNRTALVGKFYIPAIVDGKPVTEIGTAYIDYQTTPTDKQFVASCTNITHITIPDSVNKIYFGSFYHCTNLKTVKMSKNIKNIEGYAFANCTKLGSIEIYTPHSFSGFTNNVFNGCTALSTFIFDANTSFSNLADYIFKDCNNIQQIYIPPTITDISNNYPTFAGVTKPFTILYGGTQAAWETLIATIPSGNANEILKSCNVLFNQKPLVMQDIYDYHDSTKQNVTDNSLDTANKTIPTAINEVYAMALGSQTGIAYTDYKSMIDTFNILPADDFFVGKNIYIETIDVPDLWIESNDESSSVPYDIFSHLTDAEAPTFVSDKYYEKVNDEYVVLTNEPANWTTNWTDYYFVDYEGFVNALDTNGYVQVGYYKLAKLETGKVDLDNYYTKSQTDNLLAPKLTEPSSGLAVGKYFRVASIDNDGHAVLECVDAPTAPIQSISAAGTALTPDANGNVDIPRAGSVAVRSYGVVRFREEYALTVTGTGYVCGMGKTETEYTGAAPQFVISKGTLENIKYSLTKAAMTNGQGAAWTDAEKNGCYDRITIRKTTLDSVLVPNANYDLGSTEQASVTLTLPTPSGTDNYSCNEIYVAFKSGSTATTLSIVGTYAGDTSYVPSANSICELSFKYVCGTWVLVAKDTALPTA